MSSLQWNSIRSCHQLLVIATVVFLFNYCVVGQQQKPVEGQYKITIPNLPSRQYQYLFRSNPIARAEFDTICNQTPDLSQIDRLETFQSLHANLSFEDAQYLTNLDYGKSILGEICSKIKLSPKSCWGYESNCQEIYLMPECYGSSLSQAKNEQEHKIAWFSQADFGYILERRKELAKYCLPDRQANYSVKSSLECTKYFRTCRANSLYIHFNVPKDIRSEQFIKKGYIGGFNCDLQKRRIAEEGSQKGFLSSWFNELEHYDKMNEETCDQTIKKQVFFVKLANTNNMYDYFNNFINFYATNHFYQKFTEDNHIIIWDNKKPRSKYELMWSAFSKNPLMHLGDLNGKRICFEKAVFTFLPGMIDGLYNDSKLIPGCSKTGLFDAFNKHVLHRLNIAQNYHPSSDLNSSPIRIGILSRNSPHRRILNEDELMIAIQTKVGQAPFKIDVDKTNFKDALLTTQNTDILIGIHGAGLTHTLFLPDWASVIELHDMGKSRYHDLARLRGVGYITADKKDELMTKLPVTDATESAKLSAQRLTDHEMFSNYRVNVDKFLSLLDIAIDKVKKNRASRFRIESVSKAKVPAEPKVTRAEAKESDNTHTEL